MGWIMVLVGIATSMVGVVGASLCPLKMVDLDKEMSMSNHGRAMVLGTMLVMSGKVDRLRWTKMMRVLSSRRPPTLPSALYTHATPPTPRHAGDLPAAPGRDRGSSGARVFD